MKFNTTLMKQLIKGFALLFTTSLIFAPVQIMSQSVASFTDIPNPSIASNNHIKVEYNSGEVIFLINNITNMAKLRHDDNRLGIQNVDAILDKVQFTSLKQAFPEIPDLPTQRKQVVNTFSGETISLANLARTYIVKLDGESIHQMHQLIEQLNSLDEIVYAEPNYIFNTQLLNNSLDSENSQTAEITEEGYVPNDPLFGQQPGIQTHNIDKVWQTTRGDGTSVIAILDTGVDYNHPDLAANIWQNPNESGQNNGFDTDGNGFVDDLIGWDFVNNNNDPMDDNMHGTHLAGIAAAVCDNNIGIAGVNCNAKIMPIKVLQSSGRGDALTIAQGVLYAANNGATVINLSLGGYAESITLRNALAEAYGSTALVAAAGNDSRCIGPGSFCAPMFPAAYSFVVGVQENGAGQENNFSNYDQDGPVFSLYPDLWNYEIKATGIGVISTIPNGQYRVLNGTSMAAPLVSGAVSLYLEQKPDDSKELLFGNLINGAANGVMNIQSTLDLEPEPKLEMVTYLIDDSSLGDGDGKPDAGEEFNLIVTVRNTWGDANNVQLSIDFAEFEDTSIAEILVDTVTVGSISSYATRTNINDPLVIKINHDVVNNRDIRFVVKITNSSFSEYTEQEIVLTINNITKVSGLIASNTTWTSNRQYLVTDNIRIAEGAELNIEPGTQVYFSFGKSIEVRGMLNAQGTKDNIIKFQGDNITPDQSSAFSGIIIAQVGTFILDFCDISGLQGGFNSNFATGSLKNTKFHNNYRAGTWVTWPNIVVKNNLFYNNVDTRINVSGSNGEFSNNLVVNNITNGVESEAYINFVKRNDSNDANMPIFNTFINTTYYSLTAYQLGLYGTASFADVSNNYFGTVNLDKVQNTVFDFQQNASLPIAVVEPFLTQPSEETPGHVWKILINGVDAQDEFHLLDPIGVGQHEVKVFFNRAMDPDRPPSISMGVREPYTQTQASGNGTWYDNHTVYTDYFDISVGTGDGINRLRVSGARDLNWFEIPVEDTRFNVVVDAAGALSGGFIATPGLGRIDLSWNEPAGEDVVDFLGFNMYRAQLNEGQSPDSLTTENMTLISSSLVTDPLYADFEVEPGEDYFYGYTIVRTNLAESSISRIVSSSPLTAEKGDANGDFVVDLLDVMAMIGYITGGNPQPFIFEAADVNEDGYINVLDVVQTISMILGTDGTMSQAGSGPLADLVKENDTFVFDATASTTGLQMEFSNIKSETSFEILPAFSGLERVTARTDSTLTLLLFSLSGDFVAPGQNELIRFSDNDVKVNYVIAATDNGEAMQVEIVNNNESFTEVPEEFLLYQNYPNPFNSSTLIRYSLPSSGDVEIQIYDLLGRRVSLIRQLGLTAGMHSVSFNASQLASGMYLYRIIKHDEFGKELSPVRKMILLK